jgi:crotonobetainyl-CoA:carnitine CoA-transferase CaiB-like acyl-CoA transferase
MTGTTAGLGAIGEPPVRVGTDIASSNAALHAAQAVLAALLDRHKSGRGQVVKVNLLQSLLYLRAGVTASHGDPDDWVGHPLDHATQPPATGWRTKDLPVTFMLGRPSQADFEGLLRTLHLEDCLDDPRFRDQGQLTLGSRIYAHQVRHLWERATLQMTSDEFSDVIVGRGGEVQRLNDYPTLFVHPQLDAIAALRKVEHPTAGTVTALDLPWRTVAAPSRDPRRG